MPRHRTLETLMRLRPVLSLRSLLSLVALSLLATVAIVGAGAAVAQTPLTLQITAPGNGAAVSNPVTVNVTVAGVTIKAASEADPNSSHLHYFVDKDPAGIVQPGQQIPSNDPSIIHSGSTAQALPNLAAGQHTVWVVLGHLDHTPYNPSVQAQVSFSVGAAAAATPAAAAPAATASSAPAASPAAPSALPASGMGPQPRTAQTVSLLAVLAAAVAMLGLVGVVLSRAPRRL